MLATVVDRDPRCVHGAGPSSRRETLDLARRSRYLAMLRRWAQERLPAGTKAASDAAGWVREILNRGNAEAEAREQPGVLLRLRARLLVEHPELLRRHPGERYLPSSRVEQLVGTDQLDAWECALAALPRRQRELAILRIEFGLDYEAIAVESGLPLPSARAETVNALAALIDALGTRAARAA